MRIQTLGGHHVTGIANYPHVTVDGAYTDHVDHSEHTDGGDEGSQDTGGER